MNLFDIMTGKARRMTYVTRYSSEPVNRRENVAEHSYWVAYVALAIGWDLNSRNPQGFCDMEHLLAHAICHDISEIVSGDVIRSYKHTNQAVLEAMKEADLGNLEEILNGDEYGPVGRNMLFHWVNAKRGGIEGDIIKFADMAVVAFYCREEHRSGNLAIDEVMKRNFEEWFHAFHEHAYLGEYVEQMFPNGRWTDMLRSMDLPSKVMYRPLNRYGNE